jgi:uncharacterized protein (DUF486 family)
MKPLSTGFSGRMKSSVTSRRMGGMFTVLKVRCLAVPANRIGYVQFSGFQLKIIQEVVTITIFIAFATLFLKVKVARNYLVAFALLGLAAFFAFAFKAPAPIA